MHTYGDCIAECLDDVVLYDAIQLMFQHHNRVMVEMYGLATSEFCWSCVAASKRRAPCATNDGSADVATGQIQLTE